MFDDRFLPVQLRFHHQRSAIFLKNLGGFRSQCAGNILMNGFG